MQDTPKSYLEVERRVFFWGELARDWLGPESEAASQVEVKHKEGSSVFRICDLLLGFHFFSIAGSFGAFVGSKLLKLALADVILYRHVVIVCIYMAYAYISLIVLCLESPPFRNIHVDVS